MGLIDLIKDGFFGRFVNFSEPGTLAAVWGFFAIGVLIQTLLNKKAKKPERQWVFLIVLVVLIIICQIASNAFPNKDYGALLTVFGFLVCMLFGSAISGIVWYIKKKARGGASNSK